MSIIIIPSIGDRGGCQIVVQFHFNDFDNVPIPIPVLVRLINLNWVYLSLSLSLLSIYLSIFSFYLYLKRRFWTWVLFILTLTFSSLNNISISLCFFLLLAPILFGCQWGSRRDPGIWSLKVANISPSGAYCDFPTLFIAIQLGRKSRMLCAVYPIQKWLVLFPVIVSATLKTSMVIMSLTVYRKIWIEEWYIRIGSRIFITKPAQRQGRFGFSKQWRH